RGPGAPGADFTSASPDPGAACCSAAPVGEWGNVLHRAGAPPYLLHVTQSFRPSMRACPRLRGLVRFCRGLRIAKGRWAPVVPGLQLLERQTQGVSCPTQCRASEA